jgi:hypothetical protein
LSANPAQGLPLAEWCEPLDVERLTAERDAALATLGPPPSGDDGGDDGGDYGDDDEAALTFTAFAKSSSAGKPTPEVRANFAKFMAAAEALVGGSNGAALLAGVGACLTAPELSAYKSEVEQGFGRLEPRQWGEAVVLARALSSWQRGPLHGSAAAMPAKPRHALATEWGHGLVVHPIYSAPTNNHREQLARDAAATATTAAAAGGTAAAAASSSSSSVTSEAFAGSGDEDAAWLFQLCARHATMLPAREIAAGILAAVALVDASAAQAALFEVLGMDAFDSMAAVLQRAPSLKKLDLGRVMKYEPATRQQQSARCGAQSSQDKPHVPASQFSIRSQAEVNAEKKARKGRQRAQRQGGGAGGAAEEDAAKDWLLDLGFHDAFLDHEQAKGDGVQRYQSSSEILGDGPREWGGGGDSARALPAGTTRAWREGYEEVRVPPPHALPRPAAGEVVDVTSALPEWAQLAFEGTRYLNRIQSAIFPVAFHSAENMLVCAPTVRFISLGFGCSWCPLLVLKSAPRYYLLSHPCSLLFLSFAPPCFWLYRVRARRTARCWRCSSWWASTSTRSRGRSTSLPSKRSTWRR